MVIRCRTVSTVQFPLAAYEDGSKFRLYANDSGLLMAMCGFEMLAAVVENTLVGPMKGGLNENPIEEDAVIQPLMISNNVRYSPNYLSPSHGAWYFQPQH